MYIWKDADPEKYYNSCMIEFDTPTEKVYEMQTQRQCYESALPARINQNKEHAARLPRASYSLP